MIGAIGRFLGSSQRVFGLATGVAATFILTNFGLVLIGEYEAATVGYAFASAMLSLVAVSVVYGAAHDALLSEQEQGRDRILRRLEKVADILTDLNAMIVTGDAGPGRLVQGRLRVALGVLGPDVTDVLPRCQAIAQLDVGLIEASHVELALDELSLTLDIAHTIRHPKRKSA